MSPSASMVLRVASAAAQASGSPPYVPPRPLVCGASMISARPVTADSGRPSAMPLAMQIRSGSMPSCSQANMAPVRAIPVWTSSAMNTTLFARHQRSNAGRNPSAGTMKPPSPWMGSMMIAARLSAPTCLEMMSMARRAANSPSVAISLSISPSRYGVRQRCAVDLGARTDRTRSCTAWISPASAIVMLVRP